MAQSLTLQTFRDPLASLALRGGRDRGWITLATAFAFCVHAAIGVALPAGKRHYMRSEDLLSELVDVDLARPQTPPPKPVPHEVERPATPSGAPRAQRAQASQPSAAAARVVTRNDMVDLTGDGFVEGTSDAYSGGTTTGSGTPSEAATLAPATSTAAPPARARIPAEDQGPDLSRPASVIGNTEWNCPFPPEADAIDDAVVKLRVEISENGIASGASVLHEPGQGFGREARRCALGRRWKPALNRAGTAIPGSVVMTVHFVR